MIPLSLELRSPKCTMVWKRGGGDGMGGAEKGEEEDSGILLPFTADIHCFLCLIWLSKGF